MSVVQDWPSVSRRTPTADEFAEDGSYGAALMVLKAEIGRRGSTPADRLRLADLLVLAGKGPEAMAMLVGIADEQAGGGSRERALEALRRAAAIEPGSPGVRERLAALDHEPRPPRPARPGRGKTQLDKGEAAPSREPLRGTRGDDASGLDRELLGLVRAFGSRRSEGGQGALGPALFDDIPHDLLGRVAHGLRVVRVREGEIVFSEGDACDSLFLVASGRVRALALGGRGGALEIDRLGAGDYFGEPAAPASRPRITTAVAVMDCALLEIDRDALRRIVAARPAARSILDRARGDRGAGAAVAGGASASPERAAAMLRAHFGGPEWSPRVRLHVAQLMLEAGQEDGAVAVLGSVAEDLAKSGQAAKGIAVLRKVERIRRRDARAGALAPLRRTTLRSPAREGLLAGATRVSIAAAGAARRERVGSLLREAGFLAVHAAPSPAIQEAAHR